jgi:hypothetical protein
MKHPSTNGANGRDRHGRFQPGNAGGPGNPLANRVAVFRKALSEAVTVADVVSIMRAMVREAAGGNVQAAGLVLDRLCGRVALRAEIDVMRQPDDPLAEAFANMDHSELEGIATMLERIVSREPAKLLEQASEVRQCEPLR